MNETWEDDYLLVSIELIDECSYFRYNTINDMLEYNHEYISTPRLSDEYRDTVATD